MSENFDIRFRLKRDMKIYTCPNECLMEDGKLITSFPEMQSDGSIIYIHKEFNPDEFEIIPQRDYFEIRAQAAIAAMQGIVSNEDLRLKFNEVRKEINLSIQKQKDYKIDETPLIQEEDYIANISVKLADALIKELKSEKGKV